MKGEGVGNEGRGEMGEGQQNKNWLFLHLQQYPLSSLLPSLLSSFLCSPSLPSPHSNVVLAVSTLLRPDW